MAGIGVSGMGRIGRLLVRRLFSQRSEQLARRVKAINCSYPPETIAHLLKYDSVHGKWDADIVKDGNDLLINGVRVHMTSERDPERISWDQHGVDLVIDATGQFTTREGATRHLTGGAERVVVTSPGTDLDLTVVMGVNDRLYDPTRHRLLSAASCTTNCVAPLLYVLDEANGVRDAWVTTVHARTSDQNHLDNPHRDLRRARSCVDSIVPTSTGVGKALKDVLPHLAPRVHGISLRVPTPDVSIVDLTATLKRRCSLADAKRWFMEAAEGSLSTVLDYSEEPLVSVDYVGNTNSAVVDGLSMMVMGEQIKVLAWYDNEWAYVCRVVDLAEQVGERMGIKCSETIRT